MNNKDYKAVIDKLNEFIAEQPSQEEAAKILGISSSILTPIRKGTYKGNTEKFLQKIADYFDLKADFNDTYREVDYANTSISKKVYDTIRICHVKGGLAVFAGDAGIGKTKAAQKYVADNPNSAVYITLNPCLTSIKSTLKILANAINAPTSSTLDDMWMNIVGKLADGMVLIFDEAQHLPIKTIETLRSFSDYFRDKNQTLGIMFIGNNETVRKLGSNRKAEFAQINNRTKQTRICTTKKIKREDIMLLFPILADNNMDAEIDFLWQISQTQQAIRGAVNLFSNAYDNGKYDLKGLVAMAKFMELDLAGLDIRTLKEAV
ncbi:MAG: AAA family ATPase [Oscillospiraceae bacterium]